MVSLRRTGVFMPATVEILAIPIGSQLVQTINKRTDPPEPDSKNDFRVLFIFSENVTGLAESDITLSAGTTLVSLTGKHAVWEATLRPPETSGIVTVTVAANATSQGNPRTSKRIRVTTFFPDADAEAPRLLFNHGLSYSWSHQNAAGSNERGIAVTPTRIVIASSGYRGYPSNHNDSYLNFFTHAGVHQPSETFTTRTPGATASAVRKIYQIDYMNEGLIFKSGSSYSRADLVDLEGTLDASHISEGALTHTRLGAMFFSGPALSTQPYTLDVNPIPHELETFARNRSTFANSIAHQDDLLYLLKGYLFSESSKGASFTLMEINASDAPEIRSHLNIKNLSSPGSNFLDIAIYGDTLYLLSRRWTPRGATVTPGVYTLDIRKYRPIAKNTKTTIPPVFVEAGETLDLTQFSPDAERIVFDVGYDKQPHLSINTRNTLSVGSGAHTCFVKLKAINRIDATVTESFGFYLIVLRAAAPVWRDVSELTMRAGSRYDLFQLVPDADSITFRSGSTRLAGSRLSNGVFTIGTVGGVSHFTAQKGSRSSHIAIAIDVIQGTGSNSSAVSGYRVEIAGIDVTSDLVGFPSVSETLDPVVLNEYRVNEASITLRNEKGKYNSDRIGNFWETHGLNTGGFQNAVKIYLAYRDGSEHLHFSGVVNEAFVPIKGATFKINCLDISSRLRKAFVDAFGTLEKWDTLRKQSEADNYEAVYVPEQSLVPMQVGTGQARRHRTDVDISRLELQSEGPTAENTGYMTATAFRTAGGVSDDPLLLRFKGQHRSEDVRFLINQLALNKEVYNTEIDLPGVTVDTPFLLNRGSIAFSVEPTRTTRVPVDWVYDATNDRILILLSNPEVHIADLLVQYDMRGDAYRVLHTFEKGIAVHRIERRNATHYYLLTSAKITQDRSARELPRQTDATGYAYDSAAVGSTIKIYHYTTATGTLTAHVAEDNRFPPQLGIQYHVGFENAHYTDTFEGIVPSYLGAFKWQGTALYYRYAKDSEFGVASVDAAGTTTKMLGQPTSRHQNHLNFAFDINSAGTLYFAYASIGAYEGIEVVSTQRLGSGRGLRSTATLTDNLSGYSIPLQIVVNLQGAQRYTFNDGHVVRITGIDGDGNTQTKTLRGTRSNGQHVIDGKFLRITSVVSGGFYGGDFSITTLPAEGSDLRIERRASDGTATQVLRSSKSFGALTDLDEAGGVFLGVHEALFHNNALYLLVQVGRVDFDEDADAYTPARQKAAGCILYKCNVTAATPALTVIDKWEFATHSACGLTVHDGSVHYVEQPSAATAFKPINPDL